MSGEWNAGENQRGVALIPSRKWVVDTALSDENCLLFSDSVLEFIAAELFRGKFHCGKILDGLCSIDEEFF